MENTRPELVQYEYERPNFNKLVDAVIALKNEGEQIYYRQPFRWMNEKGEPQSNCYEGFPAESIAESKGLKIARMYGGHIFVGVPKEKTQANENQQTV